MTSWIKPGVKCTPIKEIEAQDGEIVPKLGQVYTIFDVMDFRPFGMPDTIGIQLVEARNKPRFYLWLGRKAECWFLASAFRPVIPMEQDIKLFRKIGLSGDPITRLDLLLEDLDA